MPQNRKVYWLSQHPPSVGQLWAWKDLHGADVEIVHENITFSSVDDCVAQLRQRSDGFVYFVGSVPHYLFAMAEGLSFGYCQNHPGKRAGGSFGLKDVWVVVDHKPHLSWSNADPEADVGDVLYRPSFRPG